MISMSVAILAQAILAQAIWLKPFWLKPFWLKAFGPQEQVQAIEIVCTHICVPVLAAASLGLALADRCEQKVLDAATEVGLGYGVQLQRGHQREREGPQASHRTRCSSCERCTTGAS